MYRSSASACGTYRRHAASAGGALADRDSGLNLAIRAYYMCVVR